MTKTLTDNPHQAGKRGAISGSLIAPDVLASSSQLLKPTRPGGASKGAQQYFSPPEVGKLAAQVLSIAGHATFDPTAGNGSLLSCASVGHRYGVEFDADQVAEGDYTAIRGDIQHVFPLLRARGIAFNRIVSNPPFGLDDWSDPVLSGGQKINSMLLTWRYCQELISERGGGVFVAGRKRFYDLVADGRSEDKSNIVLSIDVDDLFDGVALPCVIVFFSPSARYYNDKETFPRFSSDRAGLTESSFINQICDAFKSRTLGFAVRPDSDRHPVAQVSTIPDAFSDCQEEYERRTGERDLSQPFDVMLRGSKISVRLSPFAKVALSKRSPLQLRTIESLDRQSKSYFAINTRDWDLLQLLVRESILTLDPNAQTTFESIVESGNASLRPIYSLNTQKRLGFLEDLNQILCIKDDPEGRFYAGTFYDISVTSKVLEEKEHRVHEDRNGTPEMRRFTLQRKLLSIRIDSTVLDESPESISFLSEHFQIPDPGDVASKHPEIVSENRRVLLEIADENDLTLDDWQLEDMSRALVKDRFLLSWSMGGGKTMAQLIMTEALIRLGRAKNVALFIAPQDLHDQWQRELTKFLGSTGRKLEVISNQADAARVRRHIRNGGEGWYITHYEALSLIGIKNGQLPHRPLSNHELERLSPRAAAASEATSTRPTTEEFCPSCLRDRRSGWTGFSCSHCGYTHSHTRVKNVGSMLSTTFKNGVIAVDELSMVRGDTSLRSLALRGMRAACRIGASGTPISNYVNDAFWGIGWTIGFGSPRFPYDYESGKSKFESDFCVIEYMMGREDEGEGHVRKRRKVLPRVTNLSMLWRLLSINQIRRRQRDMGEMVERTFHTIEVPFGTEQLAINKEWLSSFPDFFAEKFPDHELVQKGLVERFQASLGLLWKMEFSATLPEADPDAKWHKREASNFTPKIFKALEIIERHVKAGDKVLVGSCLVDTGPYISELLAARGIKTAHITEQTSTGKAKTKSPKKRAQAVTDFVAGDTQVLTAGVQSMKLGHNLDVASVVVLIGFPWSYEAFDQFLARVWRRSSKKPVDVYCLMVKNSIDTRKFELLSDKAAASDIALDGFLVEEPEKPQNWNKVLAEMKDNGLRASGDEIPESSIRMKWRSRPTFKMPPRNQQGPSSPMRRPDHTANHPDRDHQPTVLFAPARK